jgi:putative ABC transport system permease protein
VTLDLFRQAWKSATARRGHAAIVAGAIAAGIAANAVVFAVVDGAILRPFPFPEPDRLVGVGAAYPRLNRGLEFFEAISGPEYAAIREQVPSLDRVAGFDLGNEPVMLGGTPERVFTAYFFDDPFRVLGVHPSAGRTFTADELRAAAPVALITHRLAQSISENPATLVGSSLRVGGRAHTVIGIVPPRVHLYDTDLWVPMPGAPATLPQNRRQFNVIGRLADGRALETANAELVQLAARITQDHRAAHAEYDGFRLEGRRWTEVHAWGMSNIAMISFVGVALLLVLITANLANLLLASAAERGREMALRAALGASRGRLAAQVLLETLVLAALGGFAGIIMAFVGIRALPTVVGDFLPPGIGLELSGRIVGFVIVVSAIAGTLVSLAPVLQLARTAPGSILSAESGRATGSRGARRLQRAIVSLEVAIALIVTGSALLLAVSVGRVLAVDPGFPQSDVMIMRITLPLPKYDGPRAMAFFDALLERLSTVASVSEASVSNQPPPGLFSRAQFSIDGQVPTDRLPSAFFTTAGPRYRETLGLELTRGRWFDDRAGRDGTREVVINEAAAARFFPGEDPLGRRLLITPPHADRRPTEIVGIVRDVRNRGLVLDPGPEIIGSVRQIPDRRQSQLYAVVRGRQGTATLLNDVRGAIAGIDPEQPVYAVSTLDAQYRAGVAARRSAATLLVLFAALALGLACLGIYGVMSRTVLSRTREIGIRAALGAERGSLRTMVIAEAMRPVVVGLVIGIAALLAGQKTLASWIYGVTPEPGTLVLTSAVLLAVGLVASAIPAWRASRIDPMEALRVD